MDNVLAGIIVLPGIVALVFLLVISYLQRQLREPAYRLWQAAWGCYAASLALLGVGILVRPSIFLIYLGRCLMIGMVMALLVSSRPAATQLRFRLSEIALTLGLIAWAGLGLRPQSLVIEFDLGLAAVMVFTAWRFYREGQRRDSIGYRLLSISLAFWALLISTRQFHDFLQNGFADIGHFLGPLPQVLLGVSMVMVMFEYERRQVQENSLALSVLEVDTSALHSPEELQPALHKLLDRVMRLARTERAVFAIRPEFRGILPSVQRGFSPEFLAAFERESLHETIAAIAFRRGGSATLRTSGQAETLRRFSDSARQLLADEGISSLTAISIQARDRNLGALIFPHGDDRILPTSQLRLLLALNMQIGLTLDNYILMHDSRRRTQEYELLTQVGQVISSRLDPYEVLRAVHTELGRLFDTANFYVAFQDGETLRFDFETIRGEIQPKRKRDFKNCLSEHIIRSRKPLLIRSAMKSALPELGIPAEGRDLKCFMGVPIRLGGNVNGVMGVLSLDREFAFSQRDLEVLQTAAGQVAVALENAMLFADARVRANDLAVLNHISARAISSQNTENMMPDIVSEIQRNFQFEHIGIGILNYGSKDIEIKAEAGTTGQLAGRRVPLGVGIIGKVARAGEFALVQDGATIVEGLLPEAQSVLCIPLTYGESLLGVLNIESTRAHAFSASDVLLLRTLADLLSTALHNAFVFQQMQQQSITDALTGIKTRRFFLEALSSEWKRASRSGRPFSVVMVDLDKFKEVNDNLGHLEGDLVLTRVGRLLEQKCRQSNVVARYGGDEFVILMPETGVEQALILSERLRLWMATDPMLNERRVTGSFGVASFPLHGSSTEDILRVADAGMYVSKHAGGNRVSTAEDVSETETSSMARQQISAYLEGYLQRESSGPESAMELVSTLRRMCAAMGDPAGNEALVEAIRSLNRSVESREPGATSHGSSVAFYAKIIGHELGLAAEELDDLVFAASIHDIGKIVVPERLLLKRSPLNEDEFNLVKMHAIVGAQIVDALPNGRRVRDLIRHHHERFDGLGYPDALKGEQIPLGARIISVADAFVNMTSDRPFATARSPIEAVNELESLSGLQFDGMVVRILSAHLKGDRMIAGTGHE